MARDKAGGNLPPSRLGQGYDLIQPLETIYIIYNEFGAQSNITSAATYRSAVGTPLTRDVVVPALKQLVDEHYALRVVAVSCPSDSDPKRDVVWEGQLHTIDLDRVVDVVETKEETLHGIIEATHNEWLDTDDHTLPLWRLKVVNGRHVVWYHNHFVADGLSGYAFHRGLLRILNGHHQEQSADATFKPKQVEPPRRWIEDFPRPFSMLQLLWDILVMHFVRFFFRSSLLFADLPIESRHVNWSDRLEKPSRCKTRLHTLRIPSEQTQAIVACCKANGVTFGALLHTVVVASAAADLYPKARLGLTSMPLSIRPFAAPAQSSDILINSVSSHMRIQKMKPYREAVIVPQSKDSGPGEDVFINSEKTWAMARGYRNHLLTALANLSFANGLLSWKLIGPSKEEIFAKAIPNVWLYQRYFLSVSNLGTFDQSSIVTKVEMEEPEWCIEDIQFSAAALRSTWGFVSPVFNVAGVKGGDCVINCTIEEGIMADSAMQKFLTNIKRRLDLLIDLEHRNDK